LVQFDEFSNHFLVVVRRELVHLLGAYVELLFAEEDSILELHVLQVGADEIFEVSDQ
jgi:hypothetical protein